MNQPKTPENNIMTIQPMRGLNGHELAFSLLEGPGILANATWNSGSRYPMETVIPAISGGSGSIV